MHITVNGEAKESDCTTLQDLLTELALNTKNVVVERNGTIVYREHYATTQLTENDTLEIVQFVGGG